MNNKDIIKYIRTEYKGIQNIRSTVIKQKDKYLCCVMGGICGGSGVGYCFNKTFLEVDFKTFSGAETLKDLINKTFK